jgi:predicted peptidase
MRWFAGALLPVVVLAAFAQGQPDGGTPALKPSAASPALLPSPPQSDTRWEPIEAFKKKAPPLAERFEKATHTNKLGETMPYRLFRPKVEAGKNYPLVLFLHGSSGSGTDNEKQLQKANMFGSLVWALPENQKDHPCFILAPQSDVNWPAVRLIPDRLPEILPGLGAGARQAVEILEDLLQKEPIDRARIYVTGHSMGGAGTWNLLCHRSDLFAAGVPVAGRANLGEIAAAAQIPIWNFHGIKDPVESVESSRAALAALQAAGGHPLYTEYPDVEHNSFLWAYTEPALVKWLFAQRKGD